MQLRVRTLLRSRMARRSASCVFAIVAGLALLEVFFRFVPQALPRQALVRLPGLGLYLYQGRAWGTEPDPEAAFRFTPGATLTIPGGAEHEDLYALGQCSPTREELAHLDRLPDATFVADAEGFRGRFGSGDPRILFLGDSFVLAKNFDLRDAWTGRVATALSVETVNVGLYAYGPPHEHAALVRCVSAYAPRRVLHVLFDGNDLPDAQGYAEWKAGGLPFWRWQVAGKSPWQTSPVRALGAWTLDGLSRTPENPLQPYRGEIAGRRVVLAFSPPYLFALAHAPEALRREPGWQPIFDALRACLDLCRQRGIDYTLVLAPSKETVYGVEALSRVPAQAAAAAAGWPPQAAARFVADASRYRNGFAAAVKAWAGSEGIACLDLLPAFDAAMRLGREPSYFAFDSHWNAAGQQIAADATVQYLKENLP